VLKEMSFRKMLKTAKQKCKFTNDSKTKSRTMNVKRGNEASVLTNEPFNDLTDSVNFMSEKFDSFGKQLQELVQSMKDMREENRILKDQNSNLRNDLNVLSSKLNVLEQKSLDNFDEILNAPEIINEDCKNTVKKNCKIFKRGN